LQVLLLKEGLTIFHSEKLIDSC